MLQKEKTERARKWVASGVQAEQVGPGGRDIGGKGPGRSSMPAARSALSVCAELRFGAAFKSRLNQNLQRANFLLLTI